MNNRIGRFLEKVMSHNMNFCHILITNGVQTDRTTDRQTDRVSCRGAPKNIVTSDCLYISDAVLYLQIT